MSDEVSIEMSGDVGELLFHFSGFSKEQQDAARAFFDLVVDPSIRPESKAIWDLATKFGLSGVARIVTPAGELGAFIIGVALVPPLNDEKRTQQLKEMIARAVAIQPERKG